VLEEIFFGGPSGAWSSNPSGASGSRRVVDRACERGADLDASDMSPTPAGARRGSRAPCLLHRFGRRLLQLRELDGRASSTVVVESQLKPFDIVPLIPILEGAGAS